MTLLHGITVTLIKKTETGTDAFDNPVYSYEAHCVDNVLVAPTTATEQLETFNLTGKKSVYQLGIPKSDCHEWENSYVQFFGETFRTIGPVSQGIESMIPLSWNKKISVEKIDESEATEIEAEL